MSETTRIRPLHLIWLVTIALLPLGQAAIAQERVGYYDYARPGLDWMTHESEHFMVHFHTDEEGEGPDRTARVVARIAEEIYGPITGLYEHEPEEKVSIILKDYEDYSNGAAFFFDNKIEIWAPSLDTDLRGEHNWLRNVITHEFTHIVQVQKTMKSDRSVPFFYVQYLRYEDVRRPDVLYGYPNGIVTYPLATLNNPAWFAEGTAQYQRAGLQYDTWDTHRDMLLRMRVLDGHLQDLAEMGDFYSKSSLEREQVYNQGFAFTTYLASRFGEDVLRETSAELADWTNWNFDRALKDAVGVSGKQAYYDWSDELRRSYDIAVAPIENRILQGEVVETEGFANHSPRYSPDGRRLAYVSNKGQDTRLSSLYVVESHDVGSKAVSIRLGLSRDDLSYTCSLGRQVVSGVARSISWRPDGKAIAFSRVTDTPEGHRFTDIYEVDLESEKTKPLTRRARAFAPAYHPTEPSVALVTQNDGSTNVGVAATDSMGDIRSLTSFDDGSQVYTPVWEPEGLWIYFSFSRQGRNRDVYRIRADGSGLTPVISTDHDERDPFVDPSGEWLYFSSDRSGIYNVYRIRVDNLDEAAGYEVAEQLTNVTGGAFSPAVREDGALIYSMFTGEGYKIARISEPSATETIFYEQPEIVRKRSTEDQRRLADRLNAFDDSDLVDAGEPVEAGVTDTETVTRPEAPETYGNVFTSFAFYPVLRFDWYADPDRLALDTGRDEGFQGGTALRNTKVGVYLSSREILEGLSFTGGLLVGPTSTDWDGFGDFFAPGRLVDLERDAFLRFDYKRGFPGFNKRWAPQLSAELFNIIRNLEKGLQVEEFPCTACYPDTTFVDVAYSLWEFALHSRSKLTAGSMLEFGYRYSPYRVRTEAFFSEEEGFTIPANSTRYFIGHGLGAKLYFENRTPYLNDDVLPLGIRAEVGYEYQPGRLLDSFDVEDGQLLPEYERWKNHQLQADLRWSARLPFGSRHQTHGIGVRVRGSTILGGEVDDFFDDYVGGLVGARGYPFYALGGNETLWLQVSYHVPLLTDLNQRLLFLRFTKVYGRLYSDAALAWSGAWPGLNKVRKDVGAELRVSLSSFYLLPSAFFVSATYGLDAFSRRLDEGFVTPDGENFVSYGDELLWHFGLLFDFEL